MLLIYQGGHRSAGKVRSESKVSMVFYIMSYVNPHDIAAYRLYARLSELAGTAWFFFPIDESLPRRPFKPEFQASFSEDLQSKPPAQMSYRDLFALSIQPILNKDRFQRYYYTIQKKVDEEMMRVWTHLRKSKMYDNTIILFSADHGELLTSHGLYGSEVVPSVSRSSPCTLDYLKSIVWSATSRCV